MKGELYINEKDAWLTWSVKLAEDSYDNLLLPADPKSNPSNDFRLQHGESIYDLEPRKSSRMVQLLFDIEGKNREDYLKKQDAFIRVIDETKGEIALRVVALQTIYYLRTDSYLNLSTGIGITSAKLSIRFKEANPKNRMKIT